MFSVRLSCRGIGKCFGPDVFVSKAMAFTVISCEPKALEVAYAHPRERNGTFEEDDKTAQRFLLAPGDRFVIPRDNFFRLKNHSKEICCELTYSYIQWGEDTPEESEAQRSRRRQSIIQSFRRRRH
jgi:hypothetical protein